MSNRIQVNVTSAVDPAGVRRETLHGREVLIVPSATMPDGIVMNGITYPAEEIEASYWQLERAPVTFGHPQVDGEYVSARDPEGMARTWVGAWNANVRRDNGRVWLDKIIDVERAGESEMGRRMLAAIGAGQPIHTSTGVYCTVDPGGNARGLIFDHDAILLDEEGAATPEQGVGIFVNSKGERQPVDVQNFDLGGEVLGADGQQSLIDRIIAVLSGLLRPNERLAMEGEEMANDDTAKLAADVGELAAKVDGIGDLVANAVAAAVKPLLDAQQAEAQIRANAEATERAGMIERVVAANMLPEAAAKEAPTATLKALVANIKQETAAPLLAPTFSVNASSREAFAATFPEK